ncbi:CDP-glycerol--poly(glycerophosphate) glycerophosphotransferase [Staphylococcus cohnii]|uniref:teichoic acid glycerol-phosphate primase TarB n=1 Tax=Staphylococcus cohnii species complex TaxID=3239053 RepID=UPI00085BCDFD|nr:teichoic acid glycerol-phosphate primase TarB [Staphylococcus ureilyticus]PTF45413.1 CDP-glycerol--poly(glycerophosphate) glycerophosphotransferase [Staphylococcus cohnii]SCT02871.1 teichoic acid biosynthesis protein [Staphylococcus cohnii subsp. cohnii]MDQ7109727.1 teichoic acid glycerol-phosphate primase TarB [Staphylococcus ureilyticus]PTG42726.1 CDP-glycerol--poly(glycerophosphate) glycerophosphotransferase [Staphylococcus cohnii]PUZ32503.1 CDP-glycerol--poly(glycerophosphate) glyceroph
MRQLIKKLYMTIISFLNLIYIKKKINHHHIVVMMTFVEDVLPIIEALNRKSYEVTVIAKESNRKYVEQLDNVTFIPAGNKKVFKHIKALSTAKIIVIDTYYLLFGGFKKKSQQTIIQTWHAVGALKNFGLTDHQVDLNNKKMVNQYKNVYRATDKYLVGGEPMVNCFKSAFGAKDDQFLRTGLPRLVPYVNLDIKQKQQALKLQYGINDKLALYVPTYREHHQANQIIDKARFETALPSYTLMSKLHPSLPQDEQHNISLQSLMVMADVIITDYSSLAIEASLLNKPTLFYVYDEANYEKVRGLNSYYYEIPEFYKAYSEEDIVHILQTHASALMPLFKNWHDYNVPNSLTQVINHIEKMVKT